MLAITNFRHPICHFNSYQDVKLGHPFRPHGLMESMNDEEENNRHPINMARKQLVAGTVPGTGNRVRIRA